MGTIRVTQRQLAQGVKVPLDERTTIIVGPTHRVFCIHGGLFDPDKNFLHPRSSDALCRLFLLTCAQGPADGLVVGHAHVVDSAEERLATSERRAQAVVQWLSGDVDGWLTNYEDSRSSLVRWGAREDALMIGHMPGFATREGRVVAASPNSAGSVTDKNPIVEWYQATRGLEVDGIAGPVTRRQLITEYHGLIRPAPAEADRTGDERSGTSSPEVAFETLGCSDNFPTTLVEEELASLGEQLRGTDGALHSLRLEVLLFDKSTGIDPVPSGPTGSEYLDLMANGLRELFRVPGGASSVAMSRLSGLLFETNKSFLLPNAVPALATLVEGYRENPSGKLLVVGHTDTTGEPAVNDPISLERAESMAAFLKDDVDAWLDRYGTNNTPKRRWGDREDTLMIQSLPRFDPQSSTDPVRQFQQTRDLEVDGVAGPLTRRALIAEYMDHDGTTLPATIELTAHGCGENFPLDDRGARIEATPEDNTEDQLDRRVELFLFDGDLGIRPPPPGRSSAPGSPEYPAWRELAQRKERDVGPGELVSQIHAQLLTEDGGAVVPEATLRISVPPEPATAVSSESGIVFVAAVPPGDYETHVTSKDGVEGSCHLVSNQLQGVARQVVVAGIPTKEDALAEDELFARLVDDEGQPLIGVHYEIAASDGTIFEGVTNEHGEVAEADVPTGEVQVVLTDTAEEAVS